MWPRSRGGTCVIVAAVPGDSRTLLRMRGCWLFEAPRERPSPAGSWTCPSRGMVRGTGACSGAGARSSCPPDSSAPSSSGLAGTWEHRACRAAGSPRPAEPTPPRCPAGRREAQSSALHTPLGGVCSVPSFIFVLRVVIKTVATRGH